MRPDDAADDGNAGALELLVLLVEVLCYACFGFQALTGLEPVEAFDSAFLRTVAKAALPASVLR